MCSTLAAELSGLVVEILCTHIKYEKGLPSGWRATSFIGSLVSALCCEAYVEHCASSSRKSLRHETDYHIQGDDVILHSSAYDLADSVDFMRGRGVVTHL